VPLSASEAAAIRELVESLPPAQKSRVLARFADARDRLLAAGLLEKLLATEQLGDAELRTLGLDYFRLGIPCPFLEEESCSIHTNRPLGCREYLVTSPASCCAEPSPAIRRIDLPAKMSVSLLQLEAAPGTRYVSWVPLSLAQEGPPLRPASRSGPQLLQELFQRMVEAGAPEGPAPVGEDCYE
jgi:Fe-S-cluster containining protein